MSNKGRTYKVMKNSLAGIGGQILAYILSFTYRTVFIYTLGQSYLGIQGLFGNILTMLSLSELGVSSTITFSLYKPIAKNDTDKVASIIQLFRNIYIIISAVITILGIVLLLNLNFFVSERPDIPESFELIFILFLCNTVCSYIFVHKQALVKADQKNYIITLYSNLFLILRNILQFAWLIYAKTYIPTLIIQIICTLACNVMLSHKANNLYPYLKQKPERKLTYVESKDIQYKIFAMAKYRFGAFVIDGTDNIIISKFVGLSAVGIYSNYLLLLSVVKQSVGLFTQALVPSVGNYAATGENNEISKLFYQIFFVSFCLYTIFTTCFFVLFNPLIKVWLGELYLFDMFTVGMIVLNFYLYGMHQGMLVFRNALGLYVHMQWKPIAEAIINLVMSILLVSRYGVVGVVIGTTVSYITTGLWVEPFVFFRIHLKTSTRLYWLKFLKYTIITLFSAIVSFIICNYVPTGGVIGLLLRLLVCLFISTMCIVAFSFRSTEFKDCTKRLFDLLNIKR